MRESTDEAIRPDSGHQGDVVLTHQLKRVLVGEDAMLNRVNSSFDGVADRAGVRGMGGCGEPTSVCNLDARSHLLCCELEVERPLAAGRTGARSHELDAFGPAPELLARCGPDAIRPVCLRSQHQPVPAGHRDRLAGRDDPRPDRSSIIGELLHCEDGAAVAADIPNGGYSVRDEIARVDEAKDCSARDGPFGDAGILAARVVWNFGMQRWM